MITACPKRKIGGEIWCSTMRGKIVFFSVLTVLSSTVHARDIFRCLAANGDVMFTNVACPANSQVQRIGSYEPAPDPPPPTSDAAAKAAAASALEAREAAQQARAAAYQAQVAFDLAQAEAQSEQQARVAAYQVQAAYDQAQVETESEQSLDGIEYAAPWVIPFYAQFGSRFHGRHHQPRHMMVASPHHAAPAPHVHGTVLTFRR